MTAPVLMVVGTASSVGKSVLVTALCRIFRQDGVRVAPFKAQNMSNNADVTADGLEIGRAQSEQAAAAGLAPRVEMNPVLLKPQGDRTSQVVLEGRPAGVLRSSDFLTKKRDLWPAVERALATMRAEHELVIAEGAGSPAETNLRAGGRVAGTYLQGLFHNDTLRHALLSGLGRGEHAVRSFDREREFDRLAQHVRSHLDLDRVRAMLGRSDAD